jgi:serine/threonine protein kinase
MNPPPDHVQSAAVADGGFRPDDRRIAQVLEEYLSGIESGRVPDRQALLAAHPDIAGDLAKCLDGLAFIEKASPHLQTSVYASTPLPEPAGEGTLGDYRLIREIGRGGMGIVYEAEQISLCRRVALKVLPFASTLDPKQLQRFKNEAYAAAQLHHTNIVPVFATGCERSVHFYAMQYIEGQTLAELIRAARDKERGTRGEGLSTEDCVRQSAVMAAPVNVDTPGPQAAAVPTERTSWDPAFFRTIAHIGIQVAEALEHAHQGGIIHRDIKPGNLLIEDASLASQSASLRIWITDFGLAHCQNQIGPTMTGDLIGTLRYMSPEQALGKRIVLDQRTDIYSLGATLYELLTLQPPFDGQDRQELLRQIAFEEPRQPRRVNKNIPPELDTIVLKALEKNPTDRFNTVQELADDLRRFLDDQPIHARRATLWQKLRKWCRRHKPLVWTILAFSALLLGAVAALASWAAYTSQRQLEQIQKAEAEAKKSEVEATLRLHSALVAQARANRLSRRPGQRFGSLNRRIN